MAQKKRGRRAADTPVRTPLTELTEALSANSATVGRRAAVVAAAGGLIAAVGLPAANQAADDEAGVVSASAEVDEQILEFSNQAKTVVPEAPQAEDEDAPSVLPGTSQSTVAKASKAPEPAPAPSQPSSSSNGGAGNGAAAGNSSAAGNGGSSEAAGEQRGSSSSRSSDRSDSSSSAPLPNGSKAQQVIALAQRYVGVPYRSGGTTPSGWDCSGFTSYVYGQVGVSLPRTSGAQKGAGRQVSRSEAQPGDIIWSPGHVGIYAGGGMMYDAGNSRTNTSYRSIDWMVKQGAVFIRVL